MFNCLVDLGRGGETLPTWWNSVYTQASEAWLGRACRFESDRGHYSIFLYIMYVVYILLSERLPKTYVGYTQNLNKRIKYHNSGKVKATKHFRPWKTIYTEEMPSPPQAKQRERYWKSGAGRRNIKRIIKGFPPRFQSRRGSSRL